MSENTATDPTLDKLNAAATDAGLTKPEETHPGDTSHDDAKTQAPAVDFGTPKVHKAHAIGNKLAMLLNGSIERSAFSDAERDLALGFCRTGADLIEKAHPEE